MRVPLAMGSEMRRLTSLDASSLCRGTPGRHLRSLQGVYRRVGWRVRAE